MQDINKIAFENNFKTAFELGYSNAASALSKMLRNKVSHNDTQHLIGKHALANAIAGRRYSYILATTEVFGDVTGKSYLLLGQRDFEILTQDINSSGHHKVDIKVEFIKELDNILSAAVISKLADHLGLKMYGNIPKWVGMVTGVADLIRSDFQDEVYISTTCFSFNAHPEIQPFFIWVMNSSIAQTLSETLS